MNTIRRRTRITNCSGGSQTDTPFFFLKLARAAFHPSLHYHKLLSALGPSKIEVWLCDSVFATDRGQLVNRYEAKSPAGFIRRLAVNHINWGYYYCVKGEIPEHKDPTKTYKTIMDYYGIAASKWARARRRKKVRTNVRYVRFQWQFVILATPGEHHFFEDEAPSIRDVRRVPSAIGGYSISHRQVRRVSQVYVRITARDFLRLKAQVPLKVG